MLRLGQMRDFFPLNNASKMKLFFILLKGMNEKMNSAKTNWLLLV